jgi:hypothetical protein
MQPHQPEKSILNVVHIHGCESKANPGSLADVCRLETDAADWLKLFGGTDQYMHAYSDAMTRAGFATAYQGSSAQASTERLQESGEGKEQASQQEGHPMQQDGKQQATDQQQESGSGASKGQETGHQSAGAATKGSVHKSSSNNATGKAGGRDLYVASGLLAYASPEQKAQLLAFLEPFASRVHYKELYLAQASGAGMAGDYDIVAPGSTHRRCNFWQVQCSAMTDVW